MANIDKRYFSNWKMKKQTSCFGATVTFEDFNDTDTLIVADLPSDAVVTVAYISVLGVASTGQKLHVNVDDDKLFGNNGADIATAGVRTGTAPVHTGTGKQVKLTPSAKLTQGEFVICIHYIEPDVSTGMPTVS